MTAAPRIKPTLIRCRSARQLNPRADDPLSDAEILFKGPGPPHYIGVSTKARRRGIFATLMEKLKANGVRLTASVLHSNHSAMADRLVKIGFAIVGSDEKETKLQWDPPPPTNRGRSGTHPLTN